MWTMHILRLHYTRHEADYDHMHWSDGIHALPHTGINYTIIHLGTANGSQV